MYNTYHIIWRKNMNRKYMDMELKQTSSHLAKLIAKGSFIRGNPVVMKRVCGNKNCRCALEGKLHNSLYISKNKDGDRKMIYVPKNLEQEVSAKIAAYQKIKDLTEKISEINYEQLKLKKQKGDV
jgi:hypothetical protein